MPKFDLRNKSFDKHASHSDSDNLHPNAPGKIKKSVHLQLKHPRIFTMLRTSFSWIFAALLCLAPSFFAQAQYATLDQALLDKLSESQDEDFLPILLLLEDAVDLQVLKEGFIAQGLPVSRRPQAVMQALKAKAEATQPPLIEFMNAADGAYQSLRRFWIGNFLAFEAQPALIEALSMRPEVAAMILDAPKVGWVEPIKGSDATAKSEGGSETGLHVIGAPEMWAMGYTGHARLAMTFDTGVWPDHPSLAQRFLPNLMPYASTWFAYDSEVPIDKPSSHGTHVSGTMLGLDPSTADTIGVAPGAYLIATDPVVSNLDFVKPLSDFMWGFEWALNPDGDENTSHDVPDVINNSWGFGPDLDEPPCPEFVVPVFNAVEAAGIANVFSAGNEGPGDSTMSVPHNINTGLVNSFTVGAINGNLSGPDFPIAEFSSRGPSLCGGEGSLLIKPEVCAPGVNVRSALSSDGYGTRSGTSMASPHVSGAVLLLKEAFPYLSGEELMLALYFSATDLGEPGEDNTYGMGLINVKAAYDYLAESHEPVPPASPDIDLALSGIDLPGLYHGCSDPAGYDLNPLVRISNKGNQSVQGISIHYGITGDEVHEYQDPNFSIDAGEEIQIELPAISITGMGLLELYVQIELIESEYDPWNNNAVKRYIQLPDAITANTQELIADDFEAGLVEDVWAVINPDEEITWSTTECLQSDGNEGQALFMNHAAYFPESSQRNYLISTRVEPSESLYELSYDYFYRRRTNNSNFFDSLGIYLEYACNSQRYELLLIGGDDLFTNEVHKPNAMPEAETDWMHAQLSVDLDQTGIDWQNEEIHLVLESINRRGNNLLIDNLNFIPASIVSATSYEGQSSAFHLYPVPSRTVLHIRFPERGQLEYFAVYDMQGRMAKGFQVAASEQAIDISSLGSGLYLVRWENNPDALPQKLLVH